MQTKDLARATGVDAQTIRYYEAQGLLPPPARQANGYRHYTTEHIDTLHFIKHAREVDFSLAQIAELLALRNNPGRASADVKALVGEHIHTLQQKIARLRAMETTLAAWHARCHGDSSPDCAIIEQLNEHTAKNGQLG